MLSSLVRDGIRAGKTIEAACQIPELKKNIEKLREQRQHMEAVHRKKLKKWAELQPHILSMQTQQTHLSNWLETLPKSDPLFDKLTASISQLQESIQSCLASLPRPLDQAEHNKAVDKISNLIHQNEHKLEQCRQQVEGEI